MFKKFVSLTLILFCFTSLAMQPKTFSDEEKKQLSEAVNRDDSESVQRLLETGMNPAMHDMKDNTLIHNAALRNCLRSLPQLLAHVKEQQDLDKYTDKQFLGGGLTAVHMAVEKGNHHVLELLLKAGADSKKQVIGELHATWTPLHFAAEEPKPQMLNMLLAHGAQPNVCTKDGETPLHFAAKTDSRYSVEILIEAGALTNVRNKQGDTPLHCAVASKKTKKTDIVEYLLQLRQTQIDARNDAGITAWQIAHKNKDYANMYLLEKAGCQKQE